ncbi:hypothetical protein LTR04_004869 [Oleoguttula sp. CCFEE 6159]|nr:hypothetical protein LTR04_004869 [Oleoguttula sp. CCFEE 6159]
MSGQRLTSSSPFPPLATEAGIYQSHLQNSLSYQSLSPTPTSAYGNTPHSLRGSPLSASSHSYPPPQPQHSGQHSQPGTPLGPPATYQRTSTHSHRDPISPLNIHKRTFSGASYGAPLSIHSGSPSAPQSMSIGQIVDSPGSYTRNNSQTERNIREFVTRMEREKSLSVSPKTVPSRQLSAQDLWPAPSEPHVNNFTAPPSQVDSAYRSGPQSMEEHSSISSTNETHTPTLAQSSSNSQTPKMKHETVANHVPSRQHTTPDAHPTPNTTVTPNPLKRPAENSTPVREIKRPKRSRRHDEPPIWARRAPGPRAPVPRPQATPLPRQEPPPRQELLPAVVRAKSPERSITGAEPLGEITRALADFLWQYVVTSDVIELEIEAKLGRLVDRSTKERIQLPVETATVINRDYLVEFQSSMTEKKHKTLNSFLNKCVQDSYNRSGQKQHAVRYEHRYERDTFQEFSSAGVSSLPANIQRNLNPAHRAKIRTTTNTKTGEQIAKILKARLADLHIYSPSTEFDYRISVSLEYAVPDALAALVVDPDVPGARVVQKQPARIKDRLSYSHLSTYLMDLTQVTDGSSGEKTHEMEIELDVVELRKHAALLESGAENRYEKVVKGLLDNCFILARAATEAQT